MYHPITYKTFQKGFCTYGAILPLSNTAQRELDHGTKPRGFNVSFLAGAHREPRRQRRQCSPFSIHKDIQRPKTFNQTSVHQSILKYHEANRKLTVNLGTNNLKFIHAGTNTAIETVSFVDYLAARQCNDSPLLRRYYGQRSAKICTRVLFCCNQTFWLVYAVTLK